MLHAAYDAFRRDMARMEAADAGDATALRNGWAVFRFHWYAQHSAEGRSLWTAMRARMAADHRPPRALTVLDALDAQAVRLVPLMDAVDAALEHGDRRVLARYARELPEAVRVHLDFKEANALPLIHGTLTPFEWGTFDVEFRREVGVRGLGVFLPWLLDGASEATRRAVLGLLPPPVRLVYRTTWLPRYLRRRRWSAPPVV
ncbi:hemerythrin domain-containing protein [Actinomadura rubrisoli]|nr:hemerythrin domain-containing protein [Actinomadura rubrisoli]